MASSLPARERLDHYRGVIEREIRRLAVERSVPAPPYEAVMAECYGWADRLGRRTLYEVLPLAIESIAYG